MNNRFIPPADYPCNQPDYRKPLPGEDLRANQLPTTRSCLPQPPLADPWDRRIITPCQLPYRLPIVTVFDGRPRPRLF